MAYLEINYEKCFKKYVLLKGDGRPRRSDHIPASDLRQYNLGYIKGLKEHSNTNNNYILFLLANLEALGKPRLAEMLYVYFLSKGWIEGL